MPTKKGHSLKTRAVHFRAWELQLLVSAMRMKYSYECLEYDSGQEKAALKLIKKLENNATQQTIREGQIT